MKHNLLRFDVLHRFFSDQWWGQLAMWTKSRSKTFQMLAEKARRQQPSGQAHCKHAFVAFMSLASFEALLETNQREKQHGFRKHRRDEHWLTEMVLFWRKFGTNIFSVDCACGFVEGS